MELREVPWFSSLPQSEQDTVARQVEVRNLRPQRSLYYQDDPARGAYFMMNGRVRLTKWRGGGRSLSLDTALPGDWLALPEALVAGPHLCDATAAAATTYVRFGVDVLPGLIKLDSFRDVVLRAVASGFYAVHEMLAADSPDRLIGRYLRRLIETTPELAVDGAVSIRITQEQLADATGLRRETVSKHLRALQGAGILAVGRGRLRIDSEAKLPE